MPSVPINKFLGLFTRSGRDTRPLGALDDVKNLVLNRKMDKLLLRTGYTSVISGSLTDVSGNKVLTTTEKIFAPSTESPESKDILIVCGKTSGFATNYFQNKWYHQSATALTSYLNWGESKSLTGTTVAAAALVATNAAQSDDYYKGWLIYNSTRGEGLYCTGYTLSTTTFALHPNLPSDWANGDTYVAYRHAHDNPGLAFAWTDPVVLKQGNNILASGGQSSVEGCLAMWSGYLYKTFFSGATPQTFWETYVCEANIESPTGVTVVNGYGATGTATTNLADATYCLAYSIETDDGQRSRLTRVNGVALTSQYLSTQAKIYFGVLNKRIRYVHYFVAQSTATTPDWTEYYFIKTVDLLAAGWTFTQTTGTTLGCHYLDANIQLNDWTGKGEDAVTFLGYTETTATTAAFSFGVISAGRLFIAKYYDPVDGLNYNDQIRYSPFASNGISQYNVLPAIDDYTQSTIEAGDPNVITSLASNENFLFITKTRGIYTVNITADPSTWILNTISRNAGSDTPKATAVTPFGIVFIKTGEDIYIWRGGKEESLGKNWLDTFRALTVTYASQWVGWYDNTNKSYRFMYTSNGSTFTTVYEMFFECPVGNSFAWTKHVFTAGIASVATISSGVVYFATGVTGVGAFDASVYTDAGAAYAPYFKIDGIVPDEKDLSHFHGWYIANEQTGTPASTLDVKISVDGTLLQETSAITKTVTLIRSGLPIIGSLGRKISIEFNTDGTPATWDTFTINEVGIEYEPRKIVGDKKVSL